MRNVQCSDDLISPPQYTSAKIKDNVNAGDCCIFKYQGKIGRGDFQLGRVVKTFPDEDGLVRRVELEMRPKMRRNPTFPYDTKILIVTVQRVAKLQMTKGET